MSKLSFIVIISFMLLFPSFAGPKDQADVPATKSETPETAPIQPELYTEEELEPVKPSSDETGGTEEASLPDSEISYDLEELPFSTRRMRELILEATQSGDIEKLRPYLGIGQNMTQLSLGSEVEDPIEFLKSQSGDEQGHEILAILEEVLEAGYARFDAGTERETFIWPYFFALPIEELTERQRVELFRIATYGDYQDMVDFGGYIFYRVGISPTGRWQFFVAGD